MSDEKKMSRSAALGVCALVAVAAFWLGTRFENARAATYRIAHPEECVPVAATAPSPDTPRAVANVPPSQGAEELAQSPEERRHAREVATLAGLMPDGGPVSLIRAAAIRRNAFRIVDEALARGSLSGADRATLLTILPELSEQDRLTLTERIARIGDAPSTPTP